MPIYARSFHLVMAMAASFAPRQDKYTYADARTETSTNIIPADNTTLYWHNVIAIIYRRA